MTKAEIQQVKLRFGIIGNNEALLRGIDVAMQVAPTDLSVLITGESGVGKESFPQIIHQYSRRKHGQYIAVNCGAIPEGTIDSELFGHEKALLQELSATVRVILVRQTEEPSFWMKWASCLCRRRPVCFVCWKAENLSRWVRRRWKRPMSALWLRPMSI